MAGRHIRHDWQTFVVWDQKSVRTLCGKTSTFSATGIPGVSDQPEVVDANGRKVFGWCSACARIAFGPAENFAVRAGGLTVHPYIKPMYEEVYRITLPIVEAYRVRQRQLRDAEKRRRATVDRPEFLR